MQRRRVSLELAEFELSRKHCGEGSRKIDPRVVRMIIDEALSEKQREYLCDYYFDGLSMRRAAELHGVSLSTVSRTIKRAENRIRRILKYQVRR